MTLYLEKHLKFTCANVCAVTSTPIHMPATLCAKEKELREKKSLKFLQRIENRKIANKLRGKRGQLSRVEDIH